MKLRKNATGSFTGYDFGNYGNSSVPHTANLATSAIKPKTTTPTTPTAPKQPDNKQQQFGGLDPRTPQGFGTWAGMLKPVTENVLQYGGFPALAGIYGAMSGSKDYQTATTPNNSLTDISHSGLLKIPTNHYANAAPTGPNYNSNIKTASRLRLPVESVDGLSMPIFTKTSDWGEAQPVQSGWGEATLPASGWGTANLGNMQQPGVGQSEPQYEYYKLPGEEQTGGGLDIKDLAKTMGAAAATYTGTKALANVGTKALTGQTLSQAAKQTLPRTAPRLLSAGASKLAPIGVDTIVNSGTDLLDAAGLYNIDNSKEFNAWQKPKLDAAGQIVRDEHNKGQWDYGYNPSAFGWNMNEFDRRTTPDDTIAFNLKTNNDTVNDIGSYATSGLNAYSNPLKSIYSANNTLRHDNAASLFSPADWADRRKLLEGKNINPDKNTGISATMLNHAIQQPWIPTGSSAKGGKNYEVEANNYRRANKYHPYYNPEGEKGKPSGGQQWLDKLMY